MATDWFGDLINAAVAWYQGKQGSKTPNFYVAPPTPEEQWVTDSKKSLFSNASGFLGGYLGGLGNLNPDYKLNTNEVGNPAFMGGIKVPSGMSFAPTTPAKTDPPKSPTGGGMDPIDKGAMKDPNGGGSVGSGSPVPGGGQDPFALGWQGPAGTGGPGSPNFQMLWDAAKKYGPSVLTSYFGGPLGSLALSIYKHFTGSSTLPSSGNNYPINILAPAGSPNEDSGSTTFGPPSPGTGFPSQGDQMPAQGALIDGVWTPFYPGGRMSR